MISTIPLRTVLKTGNMAFAVPLLQALLCVIISVVTVIMRQRSKEKDSEAQKRYERHCKRIDNLIKNESERLENEKQLSVMLEQDLTQLKRLRSYVGTVLDYYYAFNIIYAAYRSLIPIAMFKQYFAAGRVNKLKGHDGAYGLYETEKQKNIISTQLSEIQGQAKTITDAMYEVRAAVKIINLQTRKLCQAANQTSDMIKQHQEIIKYNSDITQQDTQCLAAAAAYNSLKEYCGRVL